MEKISQVLHTPTFPNTLTTPVSLKKHAFLFVAAAVEEVDVRGGDLQTTFDNVHQSDQLHIFRDHQLLLPCVLFNVGTAKR